MIHPWLDDTWRRFVALGDRLPHALLLVGPAGAGKRDFANAAAARLLCNAPDDAGHACGRCQSCQLRLAGNHPDLFLVIPAADAATEGVESATPETAGKARSAQIVIEQVRDLQQSLNVTGHQSSRRVIVVSPADAMNVYTANALLKLLEEPPQGCTFLLVSSMPRRLLPTIRSRCQQWIFARPRPEAVANWLQGRDGDARALLAVSGGMPLEAERLAANGAGASLVRFVRDVSRLPDGDPLGLAGQWDAWLKSGEAIEAGFGMVQLVDWMQRWVTDLAALRLGGRIRYFPGQDGMLNALAARASVAAVVNCYNELSRMRRVAQHPLNARLMIEDMLLRYVRTLTGSRP
jgi:DNA polymerase III subunit delta'